MIFSYSSGRVLSDNAENSHEKIIIFPWRTIQGLPGKYNLTLSCMV